MYANQVSPKLLLSLDQVMFLFENPLHRLEHCLDAAELELISINEDKSYDLCLSMLYRLCPVIEYFLDRIPLNCEDQEQAKKNRSLLKRAFKIYQGYQCESYLIQNVSDDPKLMVDILSVWNRMRELLGTN